MIQLQKLKLETFLPYRLSVLSNLVSKAVAALYEERFDLTLPEWRVMAVLGRTANLSASQICEITAMDKVAISRAVRRLVIMERVKAIADTGDARKQLLCLSSHGEKIYKEVVPLALQVEAQLLQKLEPEHLQTLDALITSLTDAARTL